MSVLRLRSSPDDLSPSDRANWLALRRMLADNPLHHALERNMMWRIAAHARKSAKPTIQKAIDRRVAQAFGLDPSAPDIYRGAVIMPPRRN